MACEYYGTPSQHGHVALYQYDETLPVSRINGFQRANVTLNISMKLNYWNITATIFG